MYHRLLYCHIFFASQESTFFYPFGGSKPHKEHMTVSALAKILYYPYETSTSVDLPHTDEEPVTEFKPLDQYSPIW